jgi:hypothetical protein
MITSAKHYQATQEIKSDVVAEKSENPWRKFAGMYKDNPVFDEVISYMEFERKEIDEDTEEKAQ